MEYKWIKGNENNITKRVQGNISKGWKPLGGPVLARQQKGGDSKSIFAQAMVREALSKSASPAKKPSAKKVPARAKKK